MKNLKLSPVSLIGIGLFFYLDVAAISFLIYDVFKDLIFVFADFPPLAVFSFIEIIKVLIYVISVLLLLRIIKGNRFDFKKLFLWMIIIYIIIQTFQFLWKLVFIPLVDDMYFYGSSTYYNFLRDNYSLNSIPTVINLCLDLFLGIILYWNRNLLLDENPESTQISEIGKN